MTPTDESPLVLRPRQIRALERGRRRAFFEDTVERVKRHWPRTCAEMEPRALRSRVRRAIIDAGRFDLWSQVDVLRYVNATFALGADFPFDEEHPWAEPLLRHPRLPAHEKSYRLIERTRQALEDRMHGPPE